MLDPARLDKIKSGGLLDVIRERPALYMGEHSLSALWHFFNGYVTALRFYDIQTKPTLPPDFHDWVAYRLHFYESTSGYKNMILKHVPDERAALDRFFELLDEHRNRKPEVVATARCDKKFSRHTLKDGGGEHVHVGTFPSILSLIAYTDDPGFFVSADDPDADFPGQDRFFPTLQSFQRRFGVSKDDLTVLNTDTFNQWLSQEDRFASRHNQK